jgi:hypothetical protein
VKKRRREMGGRGLMICPTTGARASRIGKELSTVSQFAPPVGEETAASASRREAVEEELRAEEKTNLPND